MPFQSLLTRSHEVSLVALVALMTSCGTETSASLRDANEGSISGSGAAGNAGAVTGATSVDLAFGDDVTEPIGALSRHSVEITVLPKDTYHVELALVGESADASLDVSSTTTNTRGKASVELTAPTETTTFRIRATVDSTISTEFEITVVDATTGNLSINRSYEGTRNPVNYVISLFPGGTCTTEALALAKPSRTVIATPQVHSIVVDKVPIGTTLAVQIEGDKLIYGCNVVNTGGGQQSFSTTVTLQDLPVPMTDATLAVNLSASNGATVLSSDLQTLTTNLVSAYQNESHDLIALLDQMHSVALGITKSEFLTMRTSSGWDETVKRTYAALGGETLLRTQLRELVDPTIARLKSDEAVELTLALLPADTGTPLAYVNRIAGLDPAPCQVTSPVALSRSITNTDQLSWSTELRLNPFKILDCSVNALAINAVPRATTAMEAMAIRFDCNAFAQTLDARVEWANGASRTCDTNCLHNLCRDAIGIMYERARAAVASTEQTVLTVSATGASTLDSDARPVSTKGTWLGRYTTTSSTYTVSGTYAPP